MKVCWMFVVLMGCSSSLPTGSESPYDCDDQGEILFFTANSSSSVTVPCHNMSRNKEEIKFNLLHDGVLIYIHNSTGGQTPSDRLSQTLSWKTVTVLKNTQGEFLGFKLTGATASSQGIYRCQGIRTFPPPLITNCSQKVVVFVKGGQGGQQEGHQFPWIWILVVVLLAAYSFTVTVFAVHSAVKLRRTECNNDYMNTKPRAPKGRKKNRGIQTPIPRHF